MNNSGRVTAAVAGFYKLERGQLLVAHDELDLPPGDVRLKEGGGAGGHNGLKDLIAQFGDGFWRLRIGIGHPGARELVTPYLLGRTPAVGTRVGSNRRCVARPTSCRCCSSRARALRCRSCTRDRTLKESTDGHPVRHRRPAERRQVDPLQRADQGADRGGELSVLHDRSERRRRRRARSAARAARGDREAAEDPAHGDGVRRHRRARRRRLEGRGPRQPVPRAHPRDRRDRARGALLRRRRHRARVRHASIRSPTST